MVVVERTGIDNVETNQHQPKGTSMKTNNYLLVTLARTSEVFFFDDRDSESIAQAEGRAQAYAIYLKTSENERGGMRTHRPAAINVYRRVPMLNYLEIGEMPERITAVPTL